MSNHPLALSSGGSHSTPNLASGYYATGNPLLSSGGSGSPLSVMGSGYVSGPIAMGAIAVVPPGYPQPNLTAREYNPASSFNIVEVYNRPYNEVSWPMCHDCHTAVPLSEEILLSVELKARRSLLRG